MKLCSFRLIVKCSYASILNDQTYLISVVTAGKGTFVTDTKSTAYCQRGKWQRQLGAKETLESLTHWQNSFKTFYKQDDIYKRFFKPNMSWNCKALHYGFAPDDNEENRRKIHRKTSLICWILYLDICPSPIWRTRYLIIPTIGKRSGLSFINTIMFRLMGKHYSTVNRWWNKITKHTDSFLNNRSKICKEALSSCWS